MGRICCEPSAGYHHVFVAIHSASDISASLVELGGLTKLSVLHTARYAMRVRPVSEVIRNLKPPSLQHSRSHGRELEYSRYNSAFLEFSLGLEEKLAGWWCRFRWLW
jgi:hypothetical protein